MKLVIIILFTCLMQVSAGTLAQKITLNERNAPLGSVIDKIRAQTGYDFIFNYNDVAKANKVSVSLDAENLNDALKEIFKNQELTYSIKDNFIVLKPKEPSFLDRLADRWANIDVFGRVVDLEGNGIPGATVSVKGSNKSVITSKNGIFNLSNVNEDAVLVISYIGFIKKEIKASAHLGDVILEQSLSKLDEVQVIAYGTTTQRLSTGNVTTIKADVIEKQPVNNPLLALQGRVPGLFIEQATGFAGTGVKVRIQGQNSINNGNDPLYVIDGVPYSSQMLPGGNAILGSSSGGEANGSPMNFINPLDIESIDVLKDADATAIYGSRAANGAILITTKKGSSGDTRIFTNLQTGWSKVGKKLGLMNNQQFLELRREAIRNAGIDLNAYPNNTEAFKTGRYPDVSGFWDNSRNVDWQKELLGGVAVYFADSSHFISGQTVHPNFDPSYPEES